MNRIDQIRRRAVQLARSGDYVDCVDIKSALVSEGYEDAYQALQYGVVRAHLKSLCDTHRRVSGSGPDF